MVWIIVPILIVLLNIPFGYWRSNVKKLSLPWFLAVHLPVPIIIFLRIHLGLGWAWTTYPLLVGAYFGGQELGGRWHERWSRSMRVSGCLLCDAARSSWIIMFSR